MTVIGIDCATSAGIAVVHRDGTRGPERLIDSATLTLDGKTAAGEIREMARGLQNWGPSLVVIEAPFTRVNPSTGLKLTLLQGRWLQEFERAGIPCRCVLASEWQHGVLKGLIGPSAKRAELKKAAKQMARACFDVDLPEDQADAACMATWALRQEAIDAVSR